MKTGIILFSVLAGLYILICLLLYAFQERMIFLPQVLGRDFKFSFKENFEERFIEMGDGKKLNALLFKAENSQGVIFFLHGNAGSLEDWGSVAETFKKLDYDLFIPDYRGYGKSEGTIKNEEQLHQDIQILYEYLKSGYAENKIIVLGHSIGSGMAAKVASGNNPKLLILQAPMYSLPDLVKNTPPFNIFPQFLIRYKFSTGTYLKKARMPVAVLHGDQDEIIYFGSSLKLQQEFKPQDTLITLQGFGHNNFLGNERYKKEIEEVLKNY